MALQQSYAEPKPLRLLHDGDRCTEDEFFAFIDVSEERWEFVADQSIAGEPADAGIVRAMAGGTDDHGVIALNLGTALNIALRGNGNRTCRASGSDRRIRTADGVNTFPDISVVCGPSAFYRNRRDTVTNPILVAEILSPSTANYDRGAKLRSYQGIQSLEHILLIEAESASVEVLSRIQGGWETQTITGIASRFALLALNIEIALADVYYLVEFEG